jgi:hypothetical protein
LWRALKQLDRLLERRHSLFPAKSAKAGAANNGHDFGTAKAIT